MSYNPDSEDALEKAAIALFEQLGWQTANAYHEAFSPDSATAAKPYLGRADRSQAVLRERLHHALANLNPDLPAEVFGQAIDELIRSRGR